MRRLRKIGYTSSLENLDAETGDYMIMIDQIYDEVADAEQKANSKRR